MPVVDGGLLPVAPEVAVATGSVVRASRCSIGTTRDESAFFTVGNPALGPAGRRRPAPVDPAV